MYCFNSNKIKDSRINIITSFSNVINVNNEGKKHGSYQRVLLKRKRNQLCITK